MNRRDAVSAGAALLILMSGLVSVIPLANAQSGVVVSIPSGAGAGQSAAPGYAPDSITVVIGVNSTVTWMNNDTVAGRGTSHTVTVKTQPPNGNWPAAGSGNMPVNTSYSFTFTIPGTYTYYCTYHSWMTGTVVVEASTSTATSTHTTPEFPAASLAVILFSVVAAVVLVASRFRPASSRMSGMDPTASRTA